MNAIVKDCNVCHGAGLVRVRFHGDQGPYGKVRAITCPDCKGRASWLSSTCADTPSALREKTK